MMHFSPLILIPLCALLNHLGGQSTTIPDPRIVCRVFGIPLVFAATALFCGASDILTVELLLTSIAGFALWAIPGWASGFVYIPPYNDTRQSDELSLIVNTIMGVGQTQKLTPSQAHVWGIIYLTLRGAYMLPFFGALAYLLNPLALPIGALCLLQGIVYGTAPTVMTAEWRFGTLVGAMLAAILLLP